MFPVKQFLHNLRCTVCNPMATRRRAAFADDAQAGGDMAYFRTLINGDKADQERRLAELRVALHANGALPWEADLLVNLVDQYRQGRRNLIMAMPPQAPFDSIAGVKAAFAFLDEAEQNVIDR